jgi:PAS domain S-box-containing protein
MNQLFSTSDQSVLDHSHCRVTPFNDFHLSSFNKASKLFNENSNCKKNKQHCLFNFAKQFISVQEDDFAQVFQTFLETICSTVHAKGSHVFIHNLELGITTKSYQWNENPNSTKNEAPKTISLSLIEPILEKHNLGLMFTCSDIELLNEFNPVLYQYLHDCNVRSFISFPIIKNSELIGALDFNCYRAGDTFSAAEIEFLIQASEIVTEAIFKKFKQHHLKSPLEIKPCLNELVKQKQHLEQIEEAMHAVKAGIWEWNVQDNTSTFSKKTAELIGYSLSEIDAFSYSYWEKQIHPDDIPILKKELYNFLNGISNSYEIVFRLRHKNGNWLYIENKSNLLTRDNLGNPKTILGIYLDVTHREQYKLNLIQSEERFRLAFKNSFLVNYIINPRTLCFEDVNEAALSFYGYSHEEFSQLKLTDINTQSASDIQLDISRLIKDGKKKFLFKHRLSNGEIRDVEVYANIIYSNSEPFVNSIIFDVTPKKRAQETLVKSLREISSYKFALDQAALVSITDTSGKIIFANNQFCNKIGFSQQELLGKNHTIIKSNYHSTAFYTELWDTILNGKVWRGHVKNKTKNGIYWWADTTIIPYLNDDNTPYQFMAIRFDITKQKEVELALNERKEFIETTVKHLPIGICANQISTGNFTLFNPTFVRILGWPEDKITTIPSLFEHVFPNPTFQKEIKKRIFRDVRSGNPETMQWNDIKICTQSGEYRIVNIKSIPLPNQDLIITSISETTETYQAYEILQKSNERFTYINKATRDAIYDWDIESGQIFRGEGYKRLFGFDYTQNKIKHWLNWIHPDDIAQVKKRLGQVLADRNQTIWTKEYRFMRSDFAYAEVIETGYIIRNSRGKAIRMIGTIRDITDLKKVELELIEINEKLKQQTIELTRSNYDLEQFAYLASHDLQEPLRMISSFLTLLEKKYNPLLDEQGKKYIYFATDGAKRMRQIILDILNFSRIGRIPMEVEELNLNVVIDQIIQLNQNLERESNASITVDPLPTLMIPKSPMVQLFQNLILNALKFRSSTTKPLVHISAKELAKEWQFSVKDNGIGIPSEFFDKIFNLFQRLHTRNEYEGTGVGLAICKKIVEQFGGKIWLESQVDVGTTFFFTINKTYFYKKDENILE